MTDREAALGGALLRACWLVRLGWDDQRVKDRLADDYYQISDRQRQLIVDLARQSYAFCASIDWTDAAAVVDLAKAPRLPQE